MLTIGARLSATCHELCIVGRGLADLTFHDLRVVGGRFSNLTFHDCRVVGGRLFHLTCFDLRVVDRGLSDLGQSGGQEGDQEHEKDGETHHGDDLDGRVLNLGWSLGWKGIFDL